MVDFPLRPSPLVHQETQQSIIVCCGKQICYQISVKNSMGDSYPEIILYREIILILYLEGKPTRTQT